MGAVTAAGVFHPSVERIFEERLMFHRNTDGWRQLARKRHGKTIEEQPEPTLDDVSRECKPSPVDADEEVTELVGMCLWDVFSDNHDVIAADGRVARFAKTRVELLQSVACIWLVTVSARPSFLEFASHGSSISLLLPKDRRAVMTFENVSTLLRQDDQCTVIAGGRRNLHEARFLEMTEVAHSRVQRSVLSVTEVAGGNNAEGTDD